MTLKSFQVKKVVKTIIQQIIAYAGPHRWPNSKPKLWVIMYHRILPPNDPRTLLEEPGMIVTPEDFEMHIKTLKKHFNIISLDQWVTACNTGTHVPKKSCIITFDDGWLDNYEYAWPVLKKHNIPATIYLVTSLIGSNYSFWTNRLARLVIKLNKQTSSPPQSPTKLDNLCAPIPKNLPTADYVSMVIHAAKQLPELEAIEIVNESEGCTPHNDDDETPDLMSWAQIKELYNSSLITFGSHTEKHSKLNTDLSKTQLHAEIISSKNTLEKELATPINHFSYPYGAYTDLAKEMARTHYTSATTTIHGINSMATDPMELKRIRVHSDISNSPQAFLSRLSGWL